MKKWLVVAVLLIALIAIAWYFGAPKQKNGDKGKNGDIVAIHPTPTIYSSDGTVKQIEGSNYTLTLADGKTVKTYTFPPDVQVVKRVVTKSGITLEPAKLSSVVVGSSVVVYSAQDTSGSHPLISKVEIVK